MQMFAEVLTKLYSVLFACLLLILVVFSAFRSDYFELGRDIEVPRYQWDRPVLVIGFFVLFVLLYFLVNRTCSDRKIIRRRVNIWLFVGLISLAISLFFLLNLQSRPYMDCLSLLENASAFNRGDYSSLSNPAHDSYLYVYPFQIGFIAYEQLVFRLFGDGNYFAIQLINVIGVFVMSCCLYCTAGEIAGIYKEKVQPVAGILLILNLPLFIDATFVYGDVLGWTFAAAAFLLLLHWIRVTDLQQDNHHYAVVLFLVPLLLAVGYLLKTNILIFCIAAAIILLLEAFSRKRIRLLLPAILCIILPLGLMRGVESHYAELAGIDRFPSGTPATCWIAMGMLEDDNFEDGWYNGFNDTTFAQSGYDPAVADKKAREVIDERLNTFLHHPGHAAKFYLRKFVSAWNDPQFDSQIKMEWGSRHVENLSEVAKWMIYGTGRTVLYWIMNLLHFTILAGAFAAVIMALRKYDLQHKLVLYLILPVLGGMLFHLLWETQARYMIGYYSALFPVAACGILYLSRNGLFRQPRKRKVIKAE